MVTMLIYLFGMLFPIGVFALSRCLWNYTISTKILALFAMLSPLVSASTRIIIWKKRQQILPQKIRGKLGYYIFFMLIPVELLFFILGVGFIIL